MEEELTNIPESRLANVASRAVGVGKSDKKRRWVIGVVLNKTEISSRKELTKIGIEAYVPSQTEIRIWKNGRKKRVERLLFKNWVFLHVNEEEQKKAINTPWIKEFYRDRVCRQTKGCPVLVIPDNQMENMRFMLYNAETPVEISNRSFKKGDEIRVVRGKLSGLTGFVSDDNDGRHTLIVELGILGFAKVQIDISDIEPLKND